MRLSIEHTPTAPYIISIDGEFTFADNSLFRDMLSQMDAAQPEQVVIDFSQVEFIDSAGLGMLLLLKERADTANSNVQIRGAHGQVLSVLELSRFQDLFDFI